MAYTRTRVSTLSTLAKHRFRLPLRLNFQLLCMASTPVKERLDVWPALPICIRDKGPISDLHNITAVLEHNNRIQYVKSFSMKFRIR